MFVNVPIGAAVWLVGRGCSPETEQRHGHFDLAGALTCTLGVTGIVLGLVEAGAQGWSARLPVGALAGGIVLLAAVHPHRAPRRGADPAHSPPHEPHAKLGQRGTRPPLCGVLRALLLHGPVPPGRTGLLAAAGGGRFPPHARVGLPLLPADQSCPAPPVAGEGCHGDGYPTGHRRAAPGHTRRRGHQLPPDRPVTRAHRCRAAA